MATRKKTHRTPIIILALIALILLIAAQSAFAEGNGWLPAKDPKDGFIYVCSNGMAFYSPVESENLPSKDLCAELLLFKNKMLELKVILNKEANFERIKKEILTSR